MRFLLIALALLCLTACGDEGTATQADVEILDHYDPTVAGEGDRKVLEQMQQAGADLSKPTDVRWYVYFEAKPAAETFKGKAQAAGWKVELLPGEDDQWLCRCSRDAVPSLAGVAAMRAELAACAGDLEAEIDGWEAAITK